MTAVEWLEEELKANLKKVILEGDSKLMESLFEQAKEMEKQQIYSEDEVREMLFMALYEPQEQFCTTHTKDSIVRKVLKTFKSE